LFADACAKAFQFTRPVILSRRSVDGSCKSGVGTYVIVNPDGHFLTAGHIVQQLVAQQEAVERLPEYERAVARIQANTTWQKKRKTRELRKLEAKSEHSVLRNSSAWWAYDGLRAENGFMNMPIDLAIGQFKGWDPNWTKEYPRFKDPDKPLRAGTSLCRLGFPLHHITAEYRDGQFHLPAEQMPPPFFPVEGIFTRQVFQKIDDWEHAYPAAFIETSSPGLRGQSGGPIFDVNGTVWGIQSQTQHFELGFQPKTGDGQVEHQFIGVGWGTHPAGVVGFMKSHGVDFRLAEY